MSRPNAWPMERLDAALVLWIRREHRWPTQDELRSDPELPYDTCFPLGGMLVYYKGLAERYPDLPPRRARPKQEVKADAWIDNECFLGPPVSIPGQGKPVPIFAESANPVLHGHKGQLVEIRHYK